MHVAEILFYNMYIPSEIRSIVDQYYSANQTNINTAFTTNTNTKLDEVKQRDILLKYLVNDDIQISANSSYTTLNEFFDLGVIGGLTDQLVIGAAAISNGVSQDHNNFRNIFNYSLWDKTEPMSINFKVVLYAKTDPLIDVVIPAYLMMSHAGIDKLPDINIFGVPGVSFHTAMTLYNRRKATNIAPDLQTAKSDLNDSTFDYDKKESNENIFVFKKVRNARGQAISPANQIKKVYYKKDPVVSNSKILSFLINGLMYIDLGMIKSINVTCSKHTAKTNAFYSKEEEFLRIPRNQITEQNVDQSIGVRKNSIKLDGDFPIWMELDIQLESIRPAVSYMLWNSLNNENVLNRPKDQNGINTR